MQFWGAMTTSELDLMVGQVLKRDGRLQRFMREKLRASLQCLSWDLNEAALDLDEFVTRIALGLTTQVDSRALQLHCATTAAASAIKHPDYSVLAGRLYAGILHKDTQKSFLHMVLSHATGPDAIFNPELVQLAERFGTDLDDAIVHSRDYMFSYASIHSLAHSYLLRVDGRIVERPQHLYMRVALATHRDNLPLVLETYDALSRHLFTFATPALANAGTLRPNFASCFLYMPDTSSPAGLLQSAHDMDRFWLADGGIGLSLGDVPCRRSRPRGHPGVLALMKVYDAHAEYTSLCRATRASAATVHLPIWHGDVRPFIGCRTTRAGREEYVRNIYVSLWIPDVFMQRTESDGSWRLFDPSDVPRLLDSFGDEFKAHYEHYERTVAPVAVVSARDLWITICRAQEESGGPFLMYQDLINQKNNQSHMGIIKTSNLCTEIVQYASPEQTAVCTLASVAVARFVRPDGSYDLERLHATTQLAVCGINALMDVASYPSTESCASAEQTRALGVGVQGLADAFMASGMPYSSPQARELNVAIFETIYHAAYTASCDLAENDGPYPLFHGSPASAGRLQHDMWPDVSLGGRYDYTALRERIQQCGLRNSMLTAQMPTASTARLLGNFDGVEPYTSNVVVHRVLSGDYTEVCRWLVRDLERRGLWSEDVRLHLLKSHGSVQAIPGLPDDVKALYRTAWEIEPMCIVDHAADRGPFIDQTQSMSLNISTPSADDLMRIQLHAWRRGLKTGIYYMRTQAPTHPLPYGVGDMSSVTKCSPPPDDGSLTNESGESQNPTCKGCSG